MATDEVYSGVPYAQAPCLSNSWQDFRSETIIFGETLPKVASDGLVSTAAPMPGGCPWCSGDFNAVYHSGPCPRIKAIEYHPNGTIKRVEFKETYMKHNPKNRQAGVKDNQAIAAIVAEVARKPKPRLRESNGFEKGDVILLSGSGGGQVLVVLEVRSSPQ